MDNLNEALNKLRILYGSAKRSHLIDEDYLDTIGEVIIMLNHEVLKRHVENERLP